MLEVKENNQRGQIITNIHGHAKSRWNKNASIKYAIIQGKYSINKIYDQIIPKSKSTLSGDISLS